MKKIILSLCVFVLSCYTANSQTILDMCGSDELLQSYLQANPEFQQTIDNYEITLTSRTNNNNSVFANPTIIYIPVVVHVIHPNGEVSGSGTNISYAQIQSQITALNRAFANNYTSPQSTGPNAFNTNIQFCLATIPSPSSVIWSGGASEPGVMRYPNTFTDIGFSENGANDLLSLTHSNSNNFPFQKYLNIWVVRSIGGLYPGVQGYAPNPLMAPPFGNGFPLDGVVIRADVFGDNTLNSNPYNLQPNTYSTNLNNEGKVLAHEVGHYLNLWHTFQNGCTGNGDYVGDTPPCLQPSSSICNATPVVSCSNNVQLENFMYYTLDPCWNTFTTGQSSRMNTFITASRSTLVSFNNLAATGVAGPGGCTGPILLADITQNPTQPCTNTSITFNTPTGPGYEFASWNWYFPGGTPSTSISQNPIITYASAGTYMVTLIATGSSGSVTNTIPTVVSNCTISDVSQANWYFGQYCAIDFNTGVPVINNTAATPQTINSGESAVSVSDPATGNLIFYTDGVKAWNNNHVAFTSTLPGNNSASQILALPYPGNPNQYMLLLPPDITGGGSFDFARIDMSGTGAVISQGAIPLPTGITRIAEHITAVPHCNGIDYWIIVHGYTTDKRFYVYRLSANGLTNSDMSQVIPDICPSSIAGFLGHLKSSANGAKLALATGSTAGKGLAVYDFNNSNGQITNEIVLATTDNYYGCSFSPNSDYLYVANTTNGSVIQYDLINNSLNPVLTGISAYGLQLGPNNKIYIARNSSTFLASIEDPNNASPLVLNQAVDFTVGNLMPPNNRLVILGLPNMVDAHPTPATPSFAYTNASCSTLVQFNAGQCFDSFSQQWNFGDGTTSNVINPSHTYASSGTFIVTLTLTSGSTSLPVITQNVTVQNTTPPVISGPLQICLGNPANYSASPISSGYIWSITPTTAGSFSGPNTGANVIVNWTGNGVLNVNASNCANTVINVVVKLNPTNVVTTTGVCSVGPCDGLANITSSGGLAPYTYVWNESPTQIGTTASGLCGGAHQVTTTDANGCSASSSYNINVDNTCSVCTYGNTAGNALTTTGVKTGIFSLKQPINVPNLTLSDAVVYMGSNAEVVIQNNGVLIIEDSHILGCPNMWKGFKFVGPYGSVIIRKGALTYNSLIEDALIAIDLTSVTNPAPGYTQIIQSTDAVFNKNFTGIAIADYAAGTNYPAEFINNVFTSRKLITNEHQVVNPALVPNYTWKASAAILTNLKTFTPVSSVNTNVVWTSPPFSIYDQFSIASNYASSQLEIPNTGTLGRFGITVANVASSTIANGFAIGTNAGTQISTSSMNLFDNLNYGIYASNSNVFVSNTAFQYMQTYPQAVLNDPEVVNIVNYLGGVALFSQNTNQTITGRFYQLQALPNQNNTSYNTSGNIFINNVTAIKTSNVQYATINTNIIHSKRLYTISNINVSSVPPMGQNAIIYNSSDYRTVDINLNKATNLHTAIWFRADYTPYTNDATDATFNAQYLGTVNINQNNLSGNYTAAIGTTALNQGIVVDNILNQTAGNSFTTTTSLIRIEKNNITNTLNGIAVTNFKARPVYTYSNTITLVSSSNTGSQYGIKHQNNKGDVIKKNTVTGFSSSTKTNLYAIYARDNVREQITCNTTNNTYEGFTFAGAANLTIWKENTMTNHKRGMHLNNTTIGVQGNATAPISNVWGASNTWQTYVTGLDPANTIPNSKLYLSTLPTVNDGFPQLNRYKGFPLAPQSLYNASGVSGINCALAPTANLNGNNGNANGVSGNGSGNGNIGNGNGNGGSVNNPDFIGNLKNIVIDAYPYERDLQGNRKNGKLLVYSEMLIDSTIYSNDTTMRNFYNQNKTSTLGKLTSTEDLLAKGDVLNAQNKMQTTTTTDIVEQNSLRFYHLYVATKNNNLSTTDNTDLINLAKGCPERDGVAVYQARVLHNSLMDAYTQYEDNCGTTPANSRLMQQDKTDAETISSKNFILFPNPNNGKVFFTADNLGLDSYDIKVYDVTGKQVYNQHYTDGVGVKILQLNLTTGLYTIHLTNIESNATYIQKMVIQQ